MQRLKAPDPQIVLFRWLTDDERGYANSGIESACKSAQARPHVHPPLCHGRAFHLQPVEELRQMLAAASLISEDPQQQLRLTASRLAEAAASQPSDPDWLLKA